MNLFFFYTQAQPLSLKRSFHDFATPTLYDASSILRRVFGGGVPFSFILPQGCKVDVGIVSNVIPMK